jgi:hypothetical protein
MFEEENPHAGNLSAFARAVQTECDAKESHRRRLEQRIVSWAHTQLATICRAPGPQAPVVVQRRAELAPGCHRHHRRRCAMYLQCIPANPVRRLG